MYRGLAEVQNLRDIQTAANLAGHCPYATVSTQCLLDNLDAVFPYRIL